MTHWKQIDASTHVLELSGKALATLVESEDVNLAAGKNLKPSRGSTAVIDWSLIPDAKPRVGETLKADCKADTAKDCKLRVHGRLARHGYQRFIPRSLDSAPIPKPEPPKPKPKKRASKKKE